MLFRRRRSRSSSVAGPWAEENAKALFTYEMLIQREMEQEAMLWETPTLALTAQAFLLTIALNHDASPAAVLASAGLGLVVAVLSLQLMAKHRFLNEMDKTLMHRIEEELGISHISRRNYFFTNKVYTVPETLSGNGHGAPKKQGFLEAQQSYRYWFRGVALFAVVNIAILAAQIWWPALLHPGAG